MSAEEGLVLNQLESTLEAELHLVQSSDASEASPSSPADWLFDPVDVERYQTGIWGLLGAVQAVEESRSRTDPMAVTSTTTSLTVADVMVAPRAIERDAHLAAAAYLMHHTPVPALIVIDDEGHRPPVTLLTERDLFRAVAHGGNAAEERVTTWASATPASVVPDAILNDAIDLMLDHDIRALPVHDAQHRLVGVLDLLSSIRANRSASRLDCLTRGVDGPDATS